MLDTHLILEKPQDIEKAAKSKGVSIDVKNLAVLLSRQKELAIQVQKLREDRNKFAKDVAHAKQEERPALIEQGKKTKTDLDEKEAALKISDEEIYRQLLQIPNPPKPDVKPGKNDTENDVIRTYKEPTKFTFEPKDHLTLGEALNIIDVEHASKVSGSRFYYLKNEGALLQFALRNLAFELLVKEGFIPVLPPVLVKREIMQALGYMENGGDEDMYQLPEDNLILVGTSEQSIVPMHRDEILNGSQLPLRYVGFSTCFRREAGSYGKDTRGILRSHQFDKIEMVSYVKQGEDDTEHEYLLSLEEKLLQLLDLPYQVVKMCTGDLGFPAARKYDIEAWVPSENKYREMTSTSTTTDFQSRRLNIRYREGQDTKYVNILNGTGFSTRPLVAILENYQQEDGSVIIPESLRKFIGKDVITAK